jgi:hypothetical protein
MLATLRVRNILATAAIAAPCGFFAWPLHERPWRGALHGYIWYGDLPGVVMLFILALLSFVCLRPIPRTPIAILFCALALIGASRRQSYEREKIQDYCESEGITDCGSRLYGLPALGWPVILSPFLSVFFLRRSDAVSGKAANKIIAFAGGKVKILQLSAVGMVAILGFLAWPWPIGGILFRDGDLPGAVVAFPALFLSIIALRAGPVALMVAILSIAAFAGVSERHALELARILNECHHCATGALPRIAEYGWPVVSMPLIALAFTRINQARIQYQNRT